MADSFYRLFFIEYSEVSDIFNKTYSIIVS